jgi:hypothetical protein
VSTPESKVKDKIKKVLKKHNVYYHMPVQNGMGAPTLDFICCFMGRYLAIEAKPGVKEPTDRQRQTIAAIQTSGGMAYLVNEDPNSDADWLDTMLSVHEVINRFEE